MPAENCMLRPVDIRPSIRIADPQRGGAEKRYPGKTHSTTSSNQFMVVTGKYRTKAFPVSRRNNILKHLAQIIRSVATTHRSRFEKSTCFLDLFRLPIRHLIAWPIIKSDNQREMSISAFSPNYATYFIFQYQIKKRGWVCQAYLSRILPTINRHAVGEENCENLYG